MTETSSDGPAPQTSRLPGLGEADPEPPAGPEAADALVISATELGRYAGWGFCPRCAWVRMHVKDLPFQGFPGIFSSIDRYNKLIVRNHFQRESCPPDWLSSLGDAREYVNPPHWSSFKVEDPDSGVTVRGEADAIFRMADGSYAIIDYKTTRYNPSYRSMFQGYRAQLNAYAYIGERAGYSPVSKLALVYMEPATDEETAQEPALVDHHGFSMGFQARLVPVDLAADELVPPLLRRARGIYEMATPPPGRRNCRDCAATQRLLEALGS